MASAANRWSEPKLSPREKLEHWMELHRWSLEKAAQRFGSNKSKVFRVLNKGQEPDLQLAVSIKNVCGIEVEEWLEQREAA